MIFFRYTRLSFLPVAISLVGGCTAVSLIFPSFFPHVVGVMRGELDESNFISAFSWLLASALVAVALAYRSGDTIKLLYSGQEEVYTSLSTADTGEEKRKVSPLSYQAPPPVSPDAYNMFDPADLPPRLAEYANMVYSACEDIGNFFGFQDSSVRNQAEHLLILLSNNRRYMSSHILPPSVQPPSPIHALHAKVFSNYMKWCRTMGVPPSFSKMNTTMSAPPAVASRVVDLVLFFCVWGEGANIRHMPECMWFLYHKMMEEYTLSEGFTQTRSLYAGHFVDNVVAPIFEIVSKVCRSHPCRIKCLRVPKFRYSFALLDLFSSCSH